MTKTCSPIGSTDRARSTASLSEPRHTSSKSFVSSRATTTCRRLRPRPRGPRGSPRRGLGDSKMIDGIVDPAIARRRSVRTRPDFGRNPKNSKRLVSKPLTTSAASAADGPGTGTTGYPASITAAESRAPGSETSGVPASDTSARSSPRLNASIAIAIRAASLWALSEMRRRFSIPTRVSSRPVCRVSSQKMASAEDRTSTACSRQVVDVADRSGDDCQSSRIPLRHPKRDRRRSLLHFESVSERKVPPLERTALRFED